MGQYHKLVNVEAGQYLGASNLGSFVKAWEQVQGTVPAALTALISRRPGNMPADLNDPMIGAWAGQRLLVVGDYSERGDIRGFKGPPLDKLYYLCKDPPELEDFGDMRYTETKYNTRTGRTERKEVFRTKEEQYADEVKNFERITRKHAALSDVSKHMRGLIEEALSLRFVESGRGMSWQVPVEPYAVKGDDHAHYMLPKGLTQEDREYYYRVCGIPKDTQYPDTLPGGRWPWDRAPLNRAQHSLTTAQMDEGQHRVYVNLTRREFFNPAAMGEVPTTAALMRGATGEVARPRMAMDMLATAGAVQTDEREGGGNDMGAASALFAMLLHPERRGGGDIAEEDFPQIGRWRDGQILLTAEVEPDGTYPTTEEAKASFQDITSEVSQALIKMSQR